MRYLLVFLFLSSQLVAADQALLPIHNIEAEHINFNEKTIHLVGNVKVVHEFGIITCQEGTLILRQEKKEGETLPVERILLKDSVSIDFSNGHMLSADEGDIDCSTLEGVFLSGQDRVVTYISSSTNGPLKTPLKATSKALKGKITKSSQGYELTALQGEGAVHIESLPTVAVIEREVS